MIACRILDSRYALKQGKVDIKNSTSKFNSYSGHHPRRLFVNEALDITGSKTECNRPGGQNNCSKTVGGLRAGLQMKVILPGSFVD